MHRRESGDTKALFLLIAHSAGRWRLAHERSARAMKGSSSVDSRSAMEGVPSNTRLSHGSALCTPACLSL